MVRNDFQGHIVTGNLEIIENQELRDIFKKGTNTKKAHDLIMKLLKIVYTQILITFTISGVTGKLKMK